MKLGVKARTKHSTGKQRESYREAASELELLLCGVC